MRILFALLVLVFAGMRGAPLLSAESAATLFQRGVDRFRAGEYQPALDDFEAAEREGLHSAELIYNYGSVLYRMGDYPRSRSYFELLTDHEQLAGVAYYNLALIAYRLDDVEQARAMFRRVAAVTADSKLKSLAQRQLLKLDEAAVQPEAAALELLGVARFDLGRDSNIELTSTETGSEQSGAFLQALVYVETPLGRRAGFDWAANATVFANAYPAESDYGFHSLAIGLVGRRDIGPWQTSLGLQPDRSWLASDPFLTTTELSLGFRRAFAGGRQLGIELSEARIDARSSAYDYLVGNQARFGLEWRAADNLRRYRLRWRLEENSRRNSATSDSSPGRQILDLRVEQDLAAGKLLRGRIEFRRSRYDEVAAARRTDDRWRLELGARQDLSGEWQFEQLLQLTENDSDLAGKDYRGALISLSLQREF